MLLNLSSDFIASFSFFILSGFVFTFVFSFQSSSSLIFSHQLIRLVFVLFFPFLFCFRPFFSLFLVVICAQVSSFSLISTVFCVFVLCYLSSECFFQLKQLYISIVYIYLNRYLCFYLILHLFDFYLFRFWISYFSLLYAFLFLVFDEIIVF